MSFDISFENLERDEIRKIKKDNIHRDPPNNYREEPLKYLCYSVNRNEKTISVPLWYFKEYMEYDEDEKIKEEDFPNSLEYFPKMKDVKFTKKLLTPETDPMKRGRNQVKVAKKALKSLRENGTTFASCHTGFGKCLGKGTKVMKFNGKSILVENIKEGDFLMGDDRTPRKVTGICNGVEDLYRVTTQKGNESFVCNVSHILSLRFENQGKISHSPGFGYAVEYFEEGEIKYANFSGVASAEIFSRSKKDKVVDISVGEYLKLSQYLKNNLKLFWSPTTFEDKEVLLDPFKFAKFLCINNSKEYFDIYEQLEEKIKEYLSKNNLNYNHASKHIPDDYKFNCEKIQYDFLQGIISDCSIYKGKNIELVEKRVYNKKFAEDIQFIARSQNYECYVVKSPKNEDEQGPFYQNISNVYRVVIFGTNNKEIYRRTTFSLDYIGAGEYYGFEVSGSNSRFLLSNHLVTHNTATAIYLSCELELKTLVLCHVKSVRKKWPEDFRYFTTNPRIDYVENSKHGLAPNKDVYILGVAMASKMSEKDFENIGTVIVDEAQICTDAIFTNVLLKIKPRYLIGLSATPDGRADSLPKLMEFYFGSPNKYIVVKEKKSFVVYKVKTLYKPEVDYMTVKGKTVPNWNKIVSSIESDENRWKDIIEIIKRDDEKTIILCNRNVLAQGIYNLLLESELKKDCELYIGSKANVDKTKKILVTGFKKAGVGFDDSKLRRAIIVSDTKDVRQYEGRIRTTDNIIYHFVDNYSSFENHWDLCEEFYREKGGTIKYGVFIKGDFKELSFEEYEEYASKNCSNSKGNYNNYVSKRRFLKKY